MICLQFAIPMMESTSIVYCGYSACALISDTQLDCVCAVRVLESVEHSSQICDYKKGLSLPESKELAKETRAAKDYRKLHKYSLYFSGEF